MTELTGLKKHILTLMVTFLLGANLSAHSEGLSPKVAEKLVARYLVIHEALVQDDLAGVKSAADQYRRTLNLYSSLSMKPSVVSMKRAAGKIHKSKDIDYAREAFQSLSAEIVDLVTDVGIRGGVPLFLVNCPTAFDQNGGYWLQVGELIENPYHGGENSNCGSLERQVGGRRSCPGR
jgi:hypothetical protein